MENIYRLLLLVISILSKNGLAQPSETREGKTINLEFYLHDVVSGENPTTIKVAQSNQTEKFSTRFGTMIMQDDPLTEGPDRNSKLIGQSQGFFGFAGESETTLVMALTFTFTDGPYKGSSISVLGRNMAFISQREMPIVGGTGAFRLTRGFVVFETHRYNSSTKDAIIHYNVTIVF